MYFCFQNCLLAQGLLSPQIEKDPLEQLSIIHTFPFLRHCQIADCRVRTFNLLYKWCEDGGGFIVTNL